MSREDTCLWQVDGHDCGKRAITRVTLKDATTKARIPVCTVHKAEHNRKAASLRARSH